MNHIYRSIWNEALGTWIAVSEIAKGQGKRAANRHKLLVTGLLVCTSPAFALPTGEQLVAGQATVSTPNANLMQINQSSQKAVINWQGFSIQQHETVNIQQPNANAALLNRVVGQDASQIQGHLNANGQVYLVNPNGVLFSRDAQVDVGGLVASTHNITNADFMNGKAHFTQNSATGTVENHGTIHTPDGGVVALIGDNVSNTGNITTPKGTTALAAGKTVDLDFKGDGLVEVKVTEAALNAQITNRGVIQADNGRVVMTAKAASQLIDTVINQEGIVRAQGLTERNGEIILDGGYVIQTGTLDVSGKTGGTVDINARAILDAGKTNADGAGRGGNITMTASDAIIQTAAAETHANGTSSGGTVQLAATNSVFSSGKLNAQGEQGGTIDVVSAERVVLAAANVDASGRQKGGSIHIGGGFHGARTKLSNNAKTTTVNGASTLKADGGDGQVVVWSEQQTDYYGSISANQAGNIEVSSKGTLTYSGSADAGIGGQLLLDPKNIIIAANAGPASYGLIDPHPTAGNLFGFHTALLGTTKSGVFTENGHIAISSPQDDLSPTATDTGAVYLFDSTTGALLAALTGSNAGDKVGLNGITALTNGNYVVSSTEWNNGAAINFAGAATWGNGITGISGIVSSANSLVGSNAFDQVSLSGITALTNGNYVVGSQYWDSSVTDVGAATWGNGITGISGIINSDNSLIGSSPSDWVSNSGITALGNGNYVVSSVDWDNAGISNAGAVTWGDGTNGTSSIIGSGNSLVGSIFFDSVGSGVTALSNGNYVVASPNWSSNFCQAHEGAVTWGNGTVGVSGTISSANSLIGLNFNDNVGSGGVTALTNGNYVIGSSSWDNGFIIDVGAATWANGSIPLNGFISSTNSLIGSAKDDFVSSQGITALTNGNYVVGSADWDNGSILNVGAATWGNGATGINGTISPSNSLIGTAANNQVASGEIVALTNGNYVVGSPFHNGVGAATWGNGAIGSSGFISSSNSLVGSNMSDSVGNFNSITALSNGNYVVSSIYWDNGSIIDAGAVTWGNGTTGSNGIISSSNSLVGSHNFDNIGDNGVASLGNGNYVVSSPNWDNGTIVDAGAATWADGTMGISGLISSTNSLVGSTAGDFVSGSSSFSGGAKLAALFAPVSSNDIIALPSDNYVVRSVFWHNGTVQTAGAVTWGNGLTGIKGVVSTINSLTGSVTSDFSDSAITGLSNGNYVLAGGYWDNAGLSNAGQVRVGTPGDIFFDYGLGQTMIFNPSTIADTLALGTNITLQASNDITLNAGANIIVGGSNGGALTLQAGRNITLNSSIFTANGDFTAIAGDPNAIAADRELGIPKMTLGSGATINTGTGKVILAAIGGNFDNNTGSTAPITAAQWLIYSTAPAQDTNNGMLFDAKHYAQPYTGVTPSYASAGNWFLYAIIPPPIRVTPSNPSITYGMTPPSFIAANFTGFIGGDTAATAGISGTPAFNINNFTGNVGSYNVAYLSGLFSSLGYTFVDDAASVNELTVNPATLTITANNANKTYGQLLNFIGTEFSHSALQNGETIGTVTLSSAGTAATASVLGSPYSITPANATGGTFNPSNYAITYLNGALTVNPANLKILANDTSKIYGQLLNFIGNEFLSDGLENGETIGTVTLSSAGTAATAAVLGSPYSITPANATGGTFNPSNYTITYLNGALTVNPANLKILANDTSKIYGQLLNFIGNEFFSDGLENGETIGTVTLSSAGTAATASVLGSPYSIIPSNATGGTFNPSNYTITYHNGALTVNPAALEILSNNTSKTYGQLLNFIGDEFYSVGLQNGETIGTVTLTSAGTAATASVLGGPYTIFTTNPTGGTFNPNNYNITYHNGELTINPATLTITANNANKTFGQLFNFTGTEFFSSGLQNGETIGTVDLSSAGAAANASVAGSPYSIFADNATGGTFDTNNYMITYRNGTLTIEPVIQREPTSPDEPIIQREPTPPDEPIIQRELVRSSSVTPENLLSQITPLQVSTLFFPWEQEEPVEDHDLLDIKNDGIKLPIKPHSIISLSMCTAETRQIPSK